MNSSIVSIFNCRFCHLPTPHDAENISKCLLQCFLDWNIDRKISTITVDNCSVNTGVIELIVDQLGDGSLVQNGIYVHMRCVAHILNLIVQDGLSLISTSIETIRESVKYWLGTPKRIEKFEETARQLKLSTSKKLSEDVKTRWNSTFLMLENAMPYKDVFQRLRQRDNRYKNVPTEEDWVFASNICDKLKIFHDTTQLVSGICYLSFIFIFFSD